MTSPVDLVESQWTDAWQRPRTTPPAARDAVIASMRLEPGELERSAGAVQLSAPGARLRRPGELVTEDGDELGYHDRLPSDLPIGYHALWHGEEVRTLLVAPSRCPLPPALREWGWAVQLYATRSRRSWGIGDLRDLRRLAAWSRGLGAGTLVVNPLAAANPARDPEPSPYYPSSRRFRSPLYLAIEDVPGFARRASRLAPLVSRATGRNAAAAIDRAAVQALKLEALEDIWRHGRPVRDGSAFDRYSADAGHGLRQWALFAALAERHGPAWPRWPAALRDPRTAEHSREAQELRDRVAFHAWVQWLLDEQLAAAGREIRLVADLPIGFDPGGFDAWCWQPLLARASLGAPPDRFNPDGQRWDLPPFVPARLRASSYGPFADTLRHVLRHAGGLRIDHILGLFRQWWVPDGAAPGEGAFVRQPTDELLAVLAIESTRANAIVVGEDLGTVPAGVRRRLSAANVLSTRLALFERRPPSSWPRKSLAAVTTHDLPTVVGAWTGADLEDQARAARQPDVNALAGLRHRLARVGSVAADADPETALVALHRAIAAAPSAIAVATLEDAALDPRRPNLPGTSRDERDNWSHALPRSLEQLEHDPFARRLARAMARD